jgi:hypothetical protein
VSSSRARSVEAGRSSGLHSHVRFIKLNMACAKVPAHPIKQLLRKRSRPLQSLATTREQMASPPRPHGCMYTRYYTSARGRAAEPKCRAHTGQKPPWVCNWHEISLLRHPSPTHLRASRRLLQPRTRLQNGEQLVCPLLPIRHGAEREYLPARHPERPDVAVQCIQSFRDIRRSNPFSPFLPMPAYILYS